MFKDSSFLSAILIFCLRGGSTVSVAYPVYTGPKSTKEGNGCAVESCVSWQFW